MKAPRGALGAQSCRGSGGGGGGGSSVELHISDHTQLDLIGSQVSWAVAHLCFNSLVSRLKPSESSSRLASRVAHSDRLDFESREASLGGSQRARASLNASACGTNQWRYAHGFAPDRSLARPSSIADLAAT